MDAPPAQHVFIQGVTRSGRIFRPSDWAERLAGVLSPFHPQAASGPDTHLRYSPWVQPTVVAGIKCVVVDRALRDFDERAWDFVMGFARDNDLVITEACPVPEPPNAG
ncbi:hypothetical protein Talka_01829 [Tepidimonas alkaliphilus]|uniref:DUF3579 domain-containing protein n=1 Tax=Tepidimonas alkaliphilus TaxID=2588942 RepID=A0A554W660_9BURK|nr:DUF3579 domain-containing protein [Tepidimonas alkaliphilus]TSE19065.1 hypothetical protein Talka_01829 [Tepidimonas alkaliphilus]